MANRGLLASFLSALFALSPLSAATILRESTPDQARVLNVWLSENPAYRLATSKDCPSCQKEIKQPDYYGYFIATDLNGDGNDDFAVVLVNQKKKAKKWVTGNFAVAVFNGPTGDATPSEPALLSEGHDLSRGGFFYGTSHQNRLLFSAYESEGCLVIPKGKGYVANCD